MKRAVVAIGALALLYLASGLFIVRGDERAVVRRFGRLVTTPSSQPLIIASGLHYDLPWPLAQVDRVNLSAIRTLTIGEALAQPSEAANLLQNAARDAQSQYLTGDKNVLHVQITAQYRIDPEHVGDYLYATADPAARLRTLIEAAAADVIARSGVDFVHPLGLAELRRLLTDTVSRLAREHRLGVEIEEVAIASVAPPLRVKADFLDVSNARADKERAINTALAYAQQRREAGRAEALERIDAAETERQRAIETARGSADRFERLVKQLRDQTSGSGQSYAAARQMMLSRRYAETVQDILREVSDKVFLESGKPVDLTILRRRDGS